MSKRDICYLCDRPAIKKCDRCGHVFCGTHVSTHSPCAQKEMEEQIRLAYKRRYARVQGTAFEEQERRSHRCYICDSYAPPEERKLQLASYFRVEIDSHRCRGCGRVICELHSRITRYRTQYNATNVESLHEARHWTYTRVKAIRHCDKCYPSRYVGGRNGLIGIVLGLGLIFGLQVWYGRGLSQGLVVGAVTLFVVGMLLVLHLPRREKDFPPPTDWWRAAAEADGAEDPLPTALQAPDPATMAGEEPQPSLLRSLRDRLRPAAVGETRPALPAPGATATQVEASEQDAVQPEDAGETGVLGDDGESAESR